MLSGAEYTDKALNLLTEADFSTETTKDIYKTFKVLQCENGAIDYVSVLQRLVTVSKYPETAVSLLECLPELLVSAENISYHIAVLKNESDKRKTIELVRDYAKSQKTDKPMSKFELIAQLETAEIADTAPTRVQVCSQVVEEMELINQGDLRLLGDSTGYAEFDKLGVRLKRGEVMIFMGRPSNGKTLMGLNLARLAGRNGHKVLIISYESKATELYSRMIYAEAKVSENVIRQGKAQMSEFFRLTEGGGRIAKYPIDYLFAPDMSVDKLRIWCRQYKRKNPDIHTIVIDYLQNIPAPKQYEFSESEYRKVTLISKQVTRMIKELNVCGVVLAQLNRKADERGNKRPIISDLRDSGQIEQDADVIIGMHREYVYTKRDEDYNNYEAAIQKNRDGMLGVVPLTIVPEMKLITSKE